MAAFIEKIHFNKADFTRPPLEELDKISGRMRPMIEASLESDDCRLKLTAEGPHTLHVSLPRDPDGNFRVALSLYSQAYEIVTRVEIPFSKIVSAYDEKVTKTETVTTPDIPGMEAARIEVESLLRSALTEWIKNSADVFFKTLSTGLVRAVFDLRAARDEVRKYDLKKVASQTDPYGGKHRTYDEHRRTS